MDPSRKSAKIIEIRGDNAHPDFTRTRTGCRGIVIRDGYILIAHEAQNDLFLTPGGGMEDGETSAECCAREIREETGYIVRPGRHFLTVYEYYEEFRYTTHYFLCDVIGKGEQNLTSAEKNRGLTAEWVEFDRMFGLTARYEDFAASDEEKRGIYLREYTALTEYLRFVRESKSGAF